MSLHFILFTLDIFLPILCWRICGKARLRSLFSNLVVSCLQLLDFSPLLMTGNELNPGDHLGGSEPQNHKLELRKVGHVKLKLLQQ